MANGNLVFALFSTSESLTGFRRANREIGVPRVTSEIGLSFCARNQENIA
jgi:hypothetical protein